MAKYTAKFIKVEEYEVEADTRDEAIEKLDSLVTFDYTESEYFDEEGECVACSY